MASSLASANVASKGSVSEPLIADREEFSSKFDEKAFEFRHRLCDSPLFSMQRLLELAKLMAREPLDYHYDVGEVSVGTKWNEIPKTKLSLTEALEQIETTNSWILLRKAHKDPEYAELLSACMHQMLELCGKDLHNMIKVENALIFITSPKRISTYHIDRECSCLLQIRGEKDIHIFDKHDRDVLPEEEIERFWTVDNNAAKYKEQFENRAEVYRLVPGNAVHIPVNAPHWVKNDNNVSVSLNFNFHYISSERANIYRANYYLRRLGLKPTPPGHSKFSDTSKRLLMGAATAVRRRVAS